MHSRVLSAAVVAFGLSLTASSATAATISVSDPSRDAPVRFDVVRTTYVNNDDLVKGTVKVPGLTKSKGNQVRLRVRPADSDSTYQLIARRYANGNTETEMAYINVVGQRSKMPCAVGANWDFANDRVGVWTRARGPQCMVEKRGVFIDAHIGLPERDAADNTATTRVSRN